MLGIGRRRQGKPAARLVVEGDRRRGSLDAGCREVVVADGSARNGSAGVWLTVFQQNRAPGLQPRSGTERETRTVQTNREGAGDNAGVDHRRPTRWINRPSERNATRCDYKAGAIQDAPSPLMNRCFSPINASLKSILSARCGPRLKLLSHCGCAFLSHRLCDGKIVP
jgi:hypothetical protein